MRERAMSDQYHEHAERTGRLVPAFDEIDGTLRSEVGGKGAHLGELSRIAGVHVPDGFCVTTYAFRRRVDQRPAVAEGLDRLSRLRPDGGDPMRALAAEIRRTIETTAIPDDLQSAIIRRLDRLGRRAAYAVGSSATAEDSPTTSFAGQHVTFLGVLGTTAILQHVRRCWASLFSERAVAYRVRNGVDHRAVHMAVVVQRMVPADASGVLFTADPVTGNRKVASVEATFGLGEALVSGLVNADVQKVRDGEVVATAIAGKQLAIRASPAGGTHERAIEPERRHRPALTDAQAVRLAELGRRIEAHFGRPQDIEWCLVDDDLHIVQSPPITTLFPIPEVGDQENHVYGSVGHQQMTTDPMTPLGLSLWQLTTPRPMSEAGGRLLVDVTRALAHPTSCAALLEMIGRSDPLMLDALQRILDRGDFIAPRPDAGPMPAASGPAPAPMEADPAVVTELIARSELSVAALQHAIRERSGPELLACILADLQELERILFDPRSQQVLMSAMDASRWLDERLEAWLGERNAADTLAQSVPHNVTSEMGLALLDVADVIRLHPEVVALLHAVEDERFLDELSGVAGGPEAHAAIVAWLDRHGMRGVGEIDVARPRWSERPSMLVPLILGNVRNFEPGAAARRFERGRLEAWTKEQELLARVRALPDGAHKAAEARRMIDRVRTFMGYREYPKYGMIRRYFVTSRPFSMRPSVSCRPQCFVRATTSSISASRSCRRSCERTGWTSGSSASAGRPTAGTER